MKVKRILGSLLWVAMMSILLVPTAMAEVDCDATGSGGDVTDCEQSFDLTSGDTGDTGDTGSACADADDDNNCDGLPLVQM